MNKSNAEVQTRFLELLAEKQRRERRTITREQVAKETGISISSVQKWALNQLSRFDSKQIVAFCDYFNCGIGDLLVIEEFEESELQSPMTAIALEVRAVTGLFVWLVAVVSASAP